MDYGRIILCQLGDQKLSKCDVSKTHNIPSVISSTDFKKIVGERIHSHSYAHHFMFYTWHIWVESKCVDDQCNDWLIEWLWLPRHVDCPNCIANNTHVVNYTSIHIIIFIKYGST